ncbi:MAG: UDP-N-acetylmuramoyl-tripeptide--D-alanyl-D-alanine ligase [Gammaproteobacteria bacterium]
MLSTATRVAEWCGGRRCGGDPILSGVCIDSRRARCGDLFVALPGARVDGHEFVAAAAEAGAAASLVAVPSRTARAQIVAGDCEIALSRLAAGWRRTFSAARVVAVSGSNGKTTVKEMLAAICRAAAGERRVLCSRGNMNNRLGLSLAVSEMRPHHRFAVLEAGMDAPGELRELGEICRPHVAVLNNAQRAHLGRFSSVAAIARAKGELVETLPADGVAVLNADDPHLSLWRELAGGRRIFTFGFGGDAEYRGAMRDGGLALPGRSAPIKLRVAGVHNARNALAAAAAAAVLQLPPESAAAGLESFPGAPGRLQFKKTAGGALLIDDSYNANPDSLSVAFSVLSECEGEKFAALGDMLALGNSAAAAHKAAVAEAAALKIHLLTTGENMKEAGAPHFSDKESLARELRNQLRRRPRAAVLVKGSRGTRMETVVRFLEDSP